MNLFELFEMFPDDRAARQWLEDVRWPDGERDCPFCASSRISVVKSEKPQPYRCKDCRRYFNVKIGMVMEGSKIPLRKWCIAIYLLSSARKGMSSIALHKALGITQKSAWYMAQRIREGWDEGQVELDGTVEVDEVYIGGKEKNKHANKKLYSGRGAVGKIPVLGAKERRSNNVYAVPVHAANSKTMTGFILDTVAPKSVVYTDEHKGYSQVGKHFYHDTVKHSKGQYVDVDTHTNGIESFWAVLKRGNYGVYHYMSPKHLHRYCNEFTGRQNAKDADQIVQMALVVRGMIGKKLPYAELTKGRIDEYG